MKMKCQSESCFNDCEREWCEYARQILQQDIMYPYVFADATRNTLERGRGKFHNVMMDGLASASSSCYSNSKWMHPVELFVVF